MSDLPFLPLWVAQYDARTAHLSLEEDGAYMRLLRMAWAAPGCRLLADDAWLRRMMRVDETTYERAVKPILVEFFYKERGYWKNRRLSEVWDAQSRMISARSAAGRKGARAKHQKTNGSGPDKASGKRTGKRMAEPKQSESESETDKACKQALEKRVREALGNGVADIEDDAIADAVDSWQRLGATEGDIVETVRRQTLHRRKRPLRSLGALTPDVQAAIAARLAKPAAPPPRERPPLVRPDGRAGLCFDAITDKFGLPAAEAWLAGAPWTEDEVVLRSEYDRAQVEQRFGGVLRQHGFSAALSAS